MMKRIVIFAAFVLVVITSYFSYRSLVRSQREQHIFCETLEPGMTDDEVLNSLKTFGAIQYSNADVEKSGYDEIAVGYTDSNVVGQNTYILSFQGAKYTGVSVIVFLDDVESLCD